MTNSKRALKTDDFTQLEIYSDSQISPDGTTYAFVSTTINKKEVYISHLYLQTINKDNHPRFSPDGKHLIFQSDRSGIPQLWLLSLNGGEAKQLTTFKNGATSPFWSKDGKKIIFSSYLDHDDDVEKQVEQTKEEREKERKEKKKQPLIVKELKYKSDARGFHDNKRSQLVMFDLETETYTQLTEAHTHHGFQDISPDG